MNVLNHPLNIVNIVRKLPPYLQNKWREHVARPRQTGGSGMQFQDLVPFVSVTTPDVTANNDNVASASGNKSADTSNTSCAATSHSNAEKVFHGILPVKIRQKGSDHVISSYCFFTTAAVVRL